MDEILAAMHRKLVEDAYSHGATQAEAELVATACTRKPEFRALAAAIAEVFAPRLM
jgi:hypothetical protein